MGSIPIAVADEKSLQGQRLLLMAHPRAQPAEVLVQLDKWVQGGGKILLLVHGARGQPLRAD